MQLAFYHFENAVCFIVALVLIGESGGLGAISEAVEIDIFVKRLLFFNFQSRFRGSRKGRIEKGQKSKLFYIQSFIFDEKMGLN
jgi:hypothetical protein